MCKIPAGSACRQELLCSWGSEGTGRTRRSGPSGESPPVVRLFRQRTEFDSLPEVGHEVKVKAQVVEGAEHRRRQLARARQVVEERPGGAPAGRAAARGIERQRVVLVAGVLDLDHALAGEEHAVAGVPRRQHAVEQVHPLGHGVEDVLGIAHAHQVAGLAGGQHRRRPLDDGMALRLGLPHGHAADGVAVEVEPGEVRRRPLAQLPVDAPLDDAEEAAARRSGIISPPGFPGPARPVERALPGGRGRFQGDRPGRALVEHHGDVDPHPLLEAHHPLGREAQGRAVQVALEGHAVRVHGAQAAQAPDLEAAAVGEDRPPPAGEGVEPAQALDHVDPRPQGQVVEVGEHDRGARRLQLLGRHPLDRAEGAHGHERRRLDDPVRSREPAPAGEAAGGEDLEGEGHGLRFGLGILPLAPQVHDPGLDVREGASARNGRRGWGRSSSCR